jgi:hypothetical protein
MAGMRQLARNIREVAASRSTEPDVRAMLNRAADRVDMSAKITYEDSLGQRHYWWTDGADERHLDHQIIDKLEILREEGLRIVKTEMTISGVDWTYEYDETGTHVVHLMRNGEDMP